MKRGLTVSYITDNNKKTQPRKNGMKDQNHKMSLKRSMDFHEIRLK